MFPRNQNAVNRQSNAVQGGRRALRDVSNRVAGEEGAKGAKSGNVSKRVTRSNVNIAVDNREDVEVESINVSAPLANVGSTSAYNSYNPTDTTSYQYSALPDDIDERDADDPLCATSYVQDMYEHFRGK